MAFGKSSSSESVAWSCQCFKLSTLKETILDVNRTSDIKDCYVLGEQLGWGQFGVIRTCADKFTGELLACKSIAKDRLVTQDDLRSVKLEIEIMSRLSGHPNVVALKAVYEEEDYVHLVMELCAGGELFHQLEKQGRYSESQAKVLFRHLMQVVMYCHDNGVVHRDLKPENILLATKASSSPIKLADFGLATYIKPGQSLHGIVGSPFYIAPEVLSGDYTQAADVWSAGVILYILLSGTPPFWGKSKSRIFDAVRAAELRFPSDPWDWVSESAKELIKKMLCVDPSKRLTAEQVLAHSWMEEATSALEDCHENNLTCSRHLDTSGGSLSVSFMARDREISFGTESAAICEPQSPAFTCRSSFSTLHVEPSTPSPLSDGFSFLSGSGSAAVEFASPIRSMPSFSFFSPGSMTDQENHIASFLGNTESTNTIHTGDVIETRYTSAHISGSDAIYSKQEPDDSKRTDGTGLRILGINKRNRTIGLGEFDQLDFVVTRSVIRWASCTHLPTALSLQPSLVC